MRLRKEASLKLIGKEAFRRTGIREIHIPGCIEELCEGCFSCCKSLSHVRFGESSSLRLIGVMVCRGSSVLEIHIPDCVEELREARFSECGSLSCVKFGESSLLKLSVKEILEILSE